MVVIVAVVVVVDVAVVDIVGPHCAVLLLLLLQFARVHRVVSPLPAF